MSYPDGPVLVIGVGNPHRGDDAVGLMVARRVKQRAPAGVTVLEHTGDGAALMDAWQGAGQVFLIDAVSSGGKPGAVIRVDCRELQGRRDPGLVSSHGFGVAQAIRLAAVLGRLPPRMALYGVEAAGFAPGAPPSPEAAGAVAHVVDLVLREIACTSTA